MKAACPSENIPVRPVRIYTPVTETMVIKIKVKIEVMSAKLQTYAFSWTFEPARPRGRIRRKASIIKKIMTGE
jgi:hypothetical protein